MKWAGHVANMGDKGNADNIFVGKLEEHLEYLGIVGCIILKWMINR
jgi:hypothetical protein